MRVVEHRDRVRRLRGIRDARFDCGVTCRSQAQNKIVITNEPATGASDGRGSVCGGRVDLDDDVEFTACYEKRSNPIAKNATDRLLKISVDTAAGTFRLCRRPLRAKRGRRERQLPSQGLAQNLQLDQTSPGLTPGILGHADHLLEHSAFTLHRFHRGQNGAETSFYQTRVHVIVLTLDQARRRHFSHAPTT
jgi:hypothetical protein